MYPLGVSVTICILDKFCLGRINNDCTKAITISVLYFKWSKNIVIGVLFILLAIA